MLKDSDPSLVGDEPLLIKRSLGVPVFVARRRAEAARALLAAYPATDLILCDDGLQHHALHHDLSLCVFDERGIGNGWMLPAGPLRDMGGTVTWTLFSGPPCPVPVKAIQGEFRVQRCLANDAVRADGSKVPLKELVGKPLHAVAGIARPQAFFAMLRAKGLSLAQTSALPDHFAFRADDAWSDGTKTIVCTEKDAVKLWRTSPNALAVPLVVELDTGFLDSLCRSLEALSSQRI